MPLLDLQHVSKSYPSEVKETPVLHDLSLSIGRGDFVAIMGPFGSGKSTLLHLVGCLDKPTSGNVLFDGIDVATCNEEDLALIRAQTIVS